MTRHDSKNFLMLIFGILLICVCGLSIAYAILMTTLNIYGSATVVSASWKIEIEDVSIRTEGSGVVLQNPIIESLTIKDFNVSLSKPGDAIYIDFSIANNGTIDAELVNSVVNNYEISNNGNGTNIDDYISSNFVFEISGLNTNVLNSSEKINLTYIIKWKDESNVLPNNNDNIILDNIGMSFLFQQK